MPFKSHWGRWFQRFPGQPVPVRRGRTVLARAVELDRPFFRLVTTPVSSYTTYGAFTTATSRKAAPPLTWGPLLCSPRLSRSRWHLHFRFIAVTFPFHNHLCLLPVGSWVHNFGLGFWKERVCLPVEVRDAKVRGAELLAGWFWDTRLLTTFLLIHFPLLGFLEFLESLLTCLSLKFPLT